MRIATWNVNSLKARIEKVEWWLERAAPDVLLMQETKLADDDAPVLPFRMAGYELLHHGEGRWNGVAIASRVGIDDVVTNFGDGPVRDSGPGLTPEVAARVFDPFYTTKEKGMGIGLYLTKRIIEAHGGTIEVRAADGGGTEFRIELPGA